MDSDLHFEQLRNAIETAVDRKMKSPRDFDFLSAAIFDKLHQTISVSTLKRFWGYMPHYATTRTATLDILAQFIDYKDFETFCQSQQQQPPRQTSFWKRWGWLCGLLAFLLIGGSLLLWLYSPNKIPADASGSNQTYILQRGDQFRTSNDYLRLFGITEATCFWDVPLPHHEGIVIWGPEYHHPVWHNDGQADSLMPTITEWWAPADSINGNGSIEELHKLASEKNRSLYFTVMRTNELRVTFMKNLVDTGYVFLGVYRTNPAQSDSTRLVWERVADRCDLLHLDYLQQLRH